jgi:3-oxoacyl-[acyl-carrier-protein] synthase-3
MLNELLRGGRLRDGQHLLCFVPESGRFSSGFIYLTAKMHA